MENVVPPVKKNNYIPVAQMTPEQLERRRASVKRAQAKYRENNLEKVRQITRKSVKDLYDRSAEHREYKALYKKVWMAEKTLRKYTNNPQE